MIEKKLSKPKKKRNLDTVAKLKQKADIAFSRYIRHRDGRWTHELGWETRCITCGRWQPLKQMQAGHFVTRAVNALRYHPRNVHGQCYGCNVGRSGDQYQYAIELDSMYGPGTAENLHSRRHETHKFTPDELKVIIHDAKVKTQELREDKPDIEVEKVYDLNEDPALDVIENALNDEEDSRRFSELVERDLQLPQLD